MPSPLSLVTGAASLLAATSSVLAYDATVCGGDGHHSRGNRYAFYPNTWAPEDGGFTCMGVHEDPPEFDVTWKWDLSPNSVNSFPHVKFQNTRIPSSIGNFTSIRLKASWGIGHGDEPFPVDGIQLGDSEEVAVRCNVGWDMFAAIDPDLAQSAVNATTEIMIWLGQFGNPWPLGYAETSEYPTQTLGDMDFNLYIGENSRGQRVLTWLCASNYTTFDADALPLISYLLDNNLVDGNEIMGLLEFGSEAFYSIDNVTFSAFDMDATVESNDPEGKYIFLGGGGDGDGGGSSGGSNDGTENDGTDEGDDEDAAVSTARAKLGFALSVFLGTALVLF